MLSSSILITFLCLGVAIAAPVAQDDGNHVNKRESVHTQVRLGDTVIDYGCGESIRNTFTEGLNNICNDQGCITLRALLIQVSMCTGSGGCALQLGSAVVGSKPMTAILSSLPLLIGQTSGSDKNGTQLAAVALGDGTDGTHSTRRPGSRPYSHTGRPEEEEEDIHVGPPAGAPPIHHNASVDPLCPRPSGHEPVPPRRHHRRHLHPAYTYASYWRDTAVVGV